MWKSLRGLPLAALVLTGLALLAAPAAAEKSPGPKGHSNVIDNAGFFSDDIVKKARSRVELIRDDFGKGLWIETIAKADSKDAVKSMAIRKYDEHKVGGVLVLISKEPEYLYIEMGKETAKRAFTQANRERLFEIFASHFRKKEFDKGLEEGIDYVGQTYNANIGKLSAQSAAGGAAGRGAASKGDSFLSKYGGWICIGLVVLLGLWLVVGLVRAFTRPAAPAGYGGGPGYGGGGGGGGGGFMSSMLGGLFGAAAGMWMYDSFFRGSSPTGGMAPSAYGDTGGAPAPDDSAGPGGGGDWGGGGAGAGGGGDWGGGGAGAGGGGDWGGGDAGGGGGDWGGGGDVGGGGDWGGGGGGDGGGGDW